MKFMYVLSISIFCIVSNVSAATISITGSNSSQDNPYEIIDSSLTSGNNMTDDIIEMNSGAGAAYLKVDEGVNFSNNTNSTQIRDYIIDATGSFTERMNIEFGGNNAFDGNIVTEMNSENFEGFIFNTRYSHVSFEDDVSFQNNYVKYNISLGSNFMRGGLISWVADVYTFKNNVVFKNNTIEIAGNATGAVGGVIYASGSGVHFGDNLVFDSNKIVSSGPNAEIQGAAMLATSNKMSIGNGAKFINNEIQSTGLNSSAISSKTIMGGAIYSMRMDASYGKNTLFETNKVNVETISNFDIVVGAGALFHGGWYSDNTNISEFDDNMTFRDNEVNVKYTTSTTGTADVYGGAAVFDIVTGNTNTPYIINIGNNATFETNKVRVEGMGQETVDAKGGALYIHNQNVIREFYVTFASDAVFDGNTVYSKAYNSNVYGGAIYTESGDISFGDGAIFKGNSLMAEGFNAANVQGGAIYAINKAKLGFSGSADFVGNNVNAANGTNAAEMNGAAVYLDNSVMNFELAEKGQRVLFEGNYIDNQITKTLSSIHLAGTSGNLAEVNVDAVKGAYVEIKDAISSDDQYAQINLDGNGGGLYLWGNNDDYYGDININSGSFYIMEDGNDAWSQRHEFSLAGATVNFGADTFLRPKIVSSSKLADFNAANVTGKANAKLAPYEMSKLDVGEYTFINDYTDFGGWSSDLAEIQTGSNVKLNIKRDLAGYEGLSSLADIYRKRSDLSYAEREVMDDLFMTGQVTQDLIDMFEVAEGQDIVNYEQAHRGSIRQFGRQIASRVYNKDCPTCGRDLGYSDEHLWMNVGHNWIDKDDTKHTLGYTYKPTSFAVGYDMDIIPRAWNVGIALGYAFGEAETKTGTVKSTNDINEYMLALYTKYKPMRAYVSGSIGGGIMTNDTHFRSEGINAKGDYDSKAFFITTEFGYDFFPSTCGVFEPYIGAEYTYLKSDAHNEKGVGARHFDSLDWNIFEVPVGVRASRDLFVNEYILTPAIDVAYVRNFGDTGASTMANFVGNAGDRWKVSSSSEKRDGYRGAFNFKINNRELPVALNIGYAIDYRSDYTDQQIYGTVRYDF